VVQNWIGKTINNRYQIEKLLGQGGMSAVYQAVDPNLRRPVAIKLIHSHLSTNPNFIQRFKEEAAAVARLRHPNIVQVHDFNADGDTYFMVMEYLIGETLQTRLRHNNKVGRHLPFSEAIRICLQLCDAIGYAHKHELIHRDIKPANVMLDLNNQAILLDFGIVKIVGGEYHTVTGATIGTVMYMSPEQIRSERVDERADIYSLGVTLFEMISGQPPYQGDSTPSLMMRVLNDPLPDLSQIREDVPNELLRVVQKAMAKEREERYQSMDDMAAELQQVQEHLIEHEPIPTVVDEVEFRQPPPSSSQLHNLVTIKDTIPEKQKEETPVSDILPHEQKIASLQTELDPPERSETDASQSENFKPLKKARMSATRKIIVAAGMLLALAVAIGGYIIYDSQKVPESIPVPLSFPTSPINAQTAEIIVNLGKWETNSNISDLAISPDSTRIGTSNNRDLPFYAQYRFYSGLWHIETGTLQRYMNGHKQRVNSVAFSPDGQLFATASNDDTVLLWQVSSGVLERNIEASAGGITSIGFSNNNMLLVAGSWDGFISLWQLNNGNLLRTMQTDDRTIFDVAFSPDDKLIASASHNNTIMLWSVSDGSLVRTLQGHTGPVFSIDFSADGSLLASASEDRTIKIWQVSDGDLLRTIKGHSDTVHDVAFSPDDSLLASGSEDYTLRLWRVTDGQLLNLLTKESDSINSVTFSPDGNLLISGGANGWVQFWGISEAIPAETEEESGSP
jgi:serine/threonine protein kinase